MTIKFIPHLPVKASHTLQQMTERFRAIEARMPWQADDIFSVYARSILADGTRWGREFLDIEDIKDALSDDEGGFALTDLDHICGMEPQWKDDNNLWIMPGQVLHRGKFKRQANETDTGIPLSINVGASLDATCLPSVRGLSGLAPDTWYAVYVDTGVAGDPVYRISDVMPDYSEGFGPEHPTNEAWRFLGVFRTGAMPDAAVRPYQMYDNGRYFWREIMVGPRDPGYDVNPDPATGNFISVDVGDHVPPCADAAFLTVEVGENDKVYVRTTDDETDPAGYFIRGPNVGQHTNDSTWLEIPVNVIDDSTGLPVTGTTIDINSDAVDDNQIGVAGFHVPRC